MTPYHRTSMCRQSQVPFGNSPTTHYMRARGRGGGSPTKPKGIVGTGEKLKDFALQRNLLFTRAFPIQHRFSFIQQSPPQPDRLPQSTVEQCVFLLKCEPPHLHLVQDSQSREQAQRAPYAFWLKIGATGADMSSAGTHFAQNTSSTVTPLS